MEPLAAAGYVMIAAAAVLAMLLGSLAGAIAWLSRCSLLWPGLLAAAGYLAETVFLESAAPGPSAVIGLPPMLMTMLISWLVAGTLERRAGLGRVWAALAGLGAALLLGFLWGFSLRLGLWPAVSLALITDACLFLVILMRRKRAAPIGSVEGL